MINFDLNIAIRLMWRHLKKPDAVKASGNNQHGIESMAPGRNDPCGNGKNP
jgi:hypothetical protein